MILYKYFPDKGYSYKGLKNATIKFSRYQELNDPYEISMAVLPMHDSEKLSASSDDFHVERIEWDCHVKKYYEQLGILCLTQNKNNILMWSHYASNHRGFVIGFDTSNDYFNEDCLFFEVEADNYDLEIMDHKKLLPVDGFGRVKKMNYVKMRKTVKSGKGEYLIEDLFFRKSFHWQYENEVRIVKNIWEYNSQANSDNNIFSYPRNVVKEVVLGANMVDKKRRKLLRIIKNKFTSIPTISQSRLNHLDYSLAFIPIEVETS